MENVAARTKIFGKPDEATLKQNGYRNGIPIRRAALNRAARLSQFAKQPASYKRKEL